MPQRILIYGAGSAGRMLAREMRQDSASRYQPAAFVDDDPRKRGRRVAGLRVWSGRALADAVASVRPSAILIAVPSASLAEMRRIVQSLEPFRLPIKTLPRLRDILRDDVHVRQIRSLAIEDLLARARVDLDRRIARSFVRGRRVLVTGAGGSIGSELCRQILRLSPASLVAVERHEASLYTLAARLASPALTPVIADVADARRLDAIFRARRPDIVFHAAAHKHVGLMEAHPCEAVKNNVTGTRLVVDAARRYGVGRFLLISSDKAVSPTSVMGATKRLAELVTLAHGAPTASIVRFGNVLGSSGSVVPKFLDQIQRGGPVTVTHPDVTRFFMSIPEAVQLVLHAAAAPSAGARLHVLDMGEPIRIVDLARQLIRLAGCVPDRDIRVEFTGLAAGEKLHETLIAPFERIDEIGAGRRGPVLPVDTPLPDRGVLDRVLFALETAAAEDDAAATRELLFAEATAAPNRVAA